MADSNPSNIANALMNLYQRPKAQNLYYNNKKVRLDGYSWEGCRFDNCTLEVLSNNFDIKDCIIDGSNRIIYGNDLLKTIKIFTSRYTWAQDYFESHFVPVVNSVTGGLTI